MHRRLALLRAACAAAVLSMAAGAFAQQPYVFPRYESAKAIDIECQRMIAEQKAAEHRLEQAPADGGAATLAALDAMLQRYGDTAGPLGLLAAVHPDKTIRDAAEACDLAYQDFSNAFFQNPRVYALLKQLQPADAIDTRELRDQLDAFEDSGVGLPLEKQARVRAISAEITRLGQEFDRRVREDKTRLPYRAAELEGVPADVWKRLPRDGQGRYLLGLDYPTVFPLLEHARRPASRERMWRAFNAVGGSENLKALAQLAELRREYAQLFGFDSYADFVLRRRMAKNAAAVGSFLDGVQGAVARREVADLEMLRAAKAADQGTPLAKTRLERWDVGYYTERVRKQKYSLDQEAFRRHFPADASLKVVMALAERLFGLRFTPLQQTLWHPDARAFELQDAASGALLGTLFVDLYPRADKYNHAAMWPVRSSASLTQRRPVAGLVANLSRKGLTIAELETLLHEFGHALHQVLSQTRYAGLGGTNVQLDFVEAPSQMLEDWVYDRQTLALFQQVCKSCPPVPEALIERAERARHFAKGIAFARQHLFASYDLALYGRTPREPMALWAAMEGATPLGHVAGSKFPASFAHIAGGYAAGYYGYLWSLVVAEDLRTAFAGHRLDPGVGRRYRDTVLANGGQVLPEDLVRQFLGRPSNNEAFFQFLAKE